MISEKCSPCHKIRVKRGRPLQANEVGHYVMTVVGHYADEIMGLGPGRTYFSNTNYRCFNGHPVLRLAWMTVGVLAWMKVGVLVGGWMTLHRPRRVGAP
jgi:hypothetical protein